MDDCELEIFLNEWEEKWNPTIPEDEPGIFARLARFFMRIFHVTDLQILYYHESFPFN
jgi:hypothetical protein